MTHPLPDHLPPHIRERIVARRRARAAEQGEPDPYPDEPATDTIPVRKLRKKTGT